MEDKKLISIFKSTNRAATYFMISCMVLFCNQVFIRNSNVSNILVKGINSICLVAIIFSIILIIKDVYTNIKYNDSDKEGYKKDLEDLLEKYGYNFEVTTKKQTINSSNIIESSGNEIELKYKLENENLVYRQFRIKNGDKECFYGTNIKIRTNLPDSIVIKNDFKNYCNININTDIYEMHGEYLVSRKLLNDDIILLKRIEKYMKFVDGYTFLVYTKAGVSEIYIEENELFYPSLGERLGKIEQIFEINI